MEPSPLSLLRSYKGEAIPSNVLNQLQYLHTLSHSTACTSQPIAHASSVKFITLCKEYNIALPVTIRNAYCPKCCMVQVASMTMQSRIIKVKNNDRVNKRAVVITGGKTERTPKKDDQDNNGNPQRRDKLKNRVLERCLVCHGKSRKSSKRYIRAALSFPQSNAGNKGSNGDHYYHHHHSRCGNDDEQQKNREVGVRRCEYQKMKRKREKDANGDDGRNGHAAKSDNEGRNASTRNTSINSTREEGHANPRKSFSFSASRANQSPGSMLSMTPAMASSSNNNNSNNTTTSLVELERIRKKQRRLQKR